MGKETESNTIDSIVESIAGVKEEVSDGGEASQVDNVDQTSDQTPAQTPAQTLANDSSTQPEADSGAENKDKPNTDTAEHWKTRYQNLEKAYSRMGTDVGQMRKELAELRQLKQQAPAPSDKKPLDSFLQDPDKFINEKVLQAELKKREEFEAQQQVYKANVSTVYAAVPEIDTLTETVIKLAKKDGITGANVELWHDTIRNDPSLAIQYALRAKEYNEYNSRVNSGQKVLQNIAKGSRSAPLVTGSKGSSANIKSDISVEDVEGLSTAEIKKRIAQMRSKR